MHSLPELKPVRDIVVEVVRACLSSTSSRDPIRKSDGSLVTKTDLVLQRATCDALRTNWPAIEVLSEEMSLPEQHAVLARGDKGLWCLDPLDGTTNFTSALPIFGVSLALVRGKPQLAIVYDPNRDECFEAERGHGAYVNQAPLSSHAKVPLSRCIACVDFKRLPAVLAERLASDPPYKSQRNLGASVLEWCCTYTVDKSLGIMQQAA